MPIPYLAGVPTQKVWLSDSAAGPPRDVVLTNIDKLIGQYDGVRNAEGFQGVFATANLYFTTDYWLKQAGLNPTMDKTRGPVVQALYEVVVDALKKMFKCQVNELPRELELMFGRELTKDGVKIDLIDRAAYYMKRAEAEQYRLIIDNRKVYQYTWWDNSNVNVRVLANSKTCASQHVKVNVPEKFKDFAFYVMSMSRDIYMTAHKTATGVDQEDGFYHSSYLAGNAVMAAGSMLIEDGVVKALRSDSGHYKPTDTNSVSLLQALEMAGAPIDQISVFNHDDSEESEARIFLGDNGNWEKLKAAYDKTKRQHKVVGEIRPQPSYPLIELE